MVVLFSDCRKLGVMNCEDAGGRCSKFGEKFLVPESQNCIITATTTCGKKVTTYESTAGIAHKLMNPWPNNVLDHVFEPIHKHNNIHI